MKCAAPVVEEVPQFFVTKLLLRSLIIVEIIYFLINKLAYVKEFFFEVGVVAVFDNIIDAIGEGHYSAAVHALLTEIAVNHSHQARLKVRFE